MGRQGSTCHYITYAATRTASSCSSLMILRHFDYGYDFEFNYYEESMWMPKYFSNKTTGLHFPPLPQLCFTTTQCHKATLSGFMKTDKPSAVGWMSRYFLSFNTFSLSCCIPAASCKLADCGAGAKMCYRSAVKIEMVFDYYSIIKSSPFIYIALWKTGLDPVCFAEANICCHSLEI